MSSNELSTVKRLASHHQRSSSTGSHGLLFGSGASSLGVGGAPPPSVAHLHLHHHHLHHQSSGSPDFLSDDDEEISQWDANGSLTGQNGAPEIQGTLSKWTNYIHGWQDRYIVLKEGSLVYYKSEFETDFGCRGAISVDKGTIKSHELDELRFDVSVSDCVWYLRAKCVEDRQRWIDALEAHKRYIDLNGPIPDGSRGGPSHHLVNLRRHDSALSLTSNASKGPFGHGNHRELKEKLSEIETFRDILCRQVDKLQSYFDACSDQQNRLVRDFGDDSDHNLITNHDPLKHSNLNTFDFKGDSITFKATTAGIVATMSNCIELMAAREDQLKRKVEREILARKRMEDKYRQLVENPPPPPAEQPSMVKMVALAGPDYEEGPHSQMGEDEFFDAVENALDKLEEEQEYRDKLKLMSNAINRQPLPPVSEATKHPLWSTIDTVTREQLHYARLEVGEDSVWELFAEDGEMRMYKREEEVDGMVVDPLKALHQVKGVTARELCHYFFSPEYRMEWETTVEQATVLEKIAPDTLIFLQLHKRVWPAAQRDALFWSHMRQVPPQELQSGFSDTWIVCNNSAKHPDAPENQGGCLRVGLTVCFVCDTIIGGDLTKDNATRDQLTTKITYCSVVNPGGWAPASVLRTIYKREYPKFLKRFTQYVIDKTKSKPILW